MNNKFAVMWNETLFVCLKHFFMIYLEAIKKTCKIPQHITVGPWEKIRTWNIRIQNNSGEQIPDAMTSGGLNFVWDRLIFMGHPYGNFLMSTFWRLEF
jgi:hypothetical protein